MRNGGGVWTLWCDVRAQAMLAETRTELTSLAPRSALSPPGKRRYNIKLWKTFTDCFNCLPVAAIIDEKIFCSECRPPELGRGSLSHRLTSLPPVPSFLLSVHGGLSPDLQSMEQIRRIMRPTDVPDTGQSHLLPCRHPWRPRLTLRLSCFPRSRRTALRSSLV